MLSPEEPEMTLAQLVDRLEALGVSMSETTEDMQGGVVVIVCDRRTERGTIFLSLAADSADHYTACERAVGLVERLWTHGPQYHDWAPAEHGNWQKGLRPTPPERQLPPDPFA